jgi:hypothetical protein
LTHLGKAEGFGAAELCNLAQISSSGKEASITRDDQLCGRPRRKLLNSFGQRNYASATQTVGAVLRDQTKYGIVPVPLDRVQNTLGGLVQESRLTKPRSPTGNRQA